jgi:hypothetical protein
MGLTLLEVLGGGVDELEGDKFEAALLEAADDVSDETALDAVGLNKHCDATDYGPLSVSDKRGMRSNRDTRRTLTIMYVRS